MIELHIYTQKSDWHLTGGYDRYETTWEGTLDVLELAKNTRFYKGTYRVATTQIGILYLRLLDYHNLRVYVHDGDGCHEIKSGMMIQPGVKIHRSNNLFSFWYNGLFKDIK